MHDSLELCTQRVHRNLISNTEWLGRARHDTVVPFYFFPKYADEKALSGVLEYHHFVWVKPV